MSLVRTFVAIECSEHLRAACDKAIGDLGDVFAGTRWVRPENIHLTLKFLGEVEDRELHSVCRKVGEAAQTVSKFDVKCRSISAFPNVERPGTIWVDVVDANDHIMELQQKVAESLTDLGFPIERRPFKAHLTLGRTRTRDSGSPEWLKIVKRNANREFGLLSVKEVVVFSSELERKWPIYTALARCPLA